MNEQKSTLLIVDDTPANLSLLANLLKDTYDVKIANNGKKCLEVVSKVRPDMILLDVMMPELDGWETCKILKQDPKTKDIPVIFLTAKNSVEDEEYGFTLGAVDFISKPISPPVVQARVKTHLQNQLYQNFLHDKADWLEAEVEKKLQAITQLQDATITVIISLAEFRDECTGLHIKRTQSFVGILARELANLPQYKELLTSEYINQLVKSAPLHDIGKISIPDDILLKPGRLTDDEMEVMKTHAQKGGDILEQAQRYLPEDSDFLSTAIEIASYHHEKYNGSGYPNGLKGEDIPLSARLMAIADVYDALTTVRPYKKAFSHEDTMGIIVKDSGTHFDPVLVDALHKCEDEFQYIATKFKDTF